MYNRWQEQRIAQPPASLKPFKAVEEKRRSYEDDLATDKAKKVRRRGELANLKKEAAQRLRDGEVDVYDL